MEKYRVRVTFTEEAEAPTMAEALVKIAMRYGR